MKSYTIICPNCKNKQTAFIKETLKSKIPYIQCIVINCGSLIFDDDLAEVTADKLTPGYHNKYK